MPSLTYSDGEVLTLGADASSGWLTSAVATPSGSTTSVNLATGLAYDAAGDVTGATVGNGMYSYAASFDTDFRPLSSTTTLASSGATLFSSARTYDAAGNVTSVSTTLPAGSGTDAQVFCYDEQNRLTWAGTSGMVPTGCTQPVTPASTVSGASYQQSFDYDTLDRLTFGPLGGYTYGAGLQATSGANGTKALLHAALAIGTESKYAAKSLPPDSSLTTTSTASSITAN